MNRKPAREIVTLSAPSKTFLVGEYLALEGGPSLILTTEPRFELRVSYAEAEASTHRKNANPFNSESPAGRFLARHQNETQGHDFEFRDPHKGKGGLGASSAQFALVYFWLQSRLEKEVDDLSRFEKWSELLEDYRVSAWSGFGRPPSGADLVAQVNGGISWYDGRTREAKRFKWDFPTLGFTLIRTGSKTATHEHLEKSPQVPFEALYKEALLATRAFEEMNERDLCEAVRNTGEALISAGLCASQTIEILKAVTSQNLHAVLAAKGCGALGADVVLVLHEKVHAEEIKRWALDRRLQICGSDQDISFGLKADRIEK